MPVDIKRVKQRHVTGCAVACVAMIAGVSYDRARRALKGKKRDLKADIDEMLTCIRELGFKCRPATDFRRKRRPAIIMFEWANAPGACHCVVWDPSNGGRFVDPAYTYPLSSEYYMGRWRALGYKALMITGKRR